MKENRVEAVKLHKYNELVKSNTTKSGADKIKRGYRKIMSIS